MNMLLLFVSAVILPIMVLAAPSSPYETTSDDLMNSEPDSNADETTIQLVNKAKSSDPKERFAAVSRIESLLWKGAIDEVVIAEFVFIGVLPVLVNCLKSTDDKLLAEAASALSNIVYFNAREVIEAGAVPPLVKLLQSPNMELCKQISWALTNISAASPELALAVVEAGAVPLLVKLLQSENMEVCKYTAWVLKNVVAAFPDLALAVVEAGAVPLLVKLLQSENMEVCKYTAWALKNIAAASPDLALAVIEAGALPPLVKLLQSPNTDVCNQAALAIEIIIDQFPHLNGIDVEHIQIMMENDFVARFCNLLGKSDEVTLKVLDGIKRVLNNAQKREKVIELIEKCGGLRKIKRLKTKESKLVLKMIEKQHSSKLD